MPSLAPLRGGRRWWRRRGRFRPRWALLGLAAWMMPLLMMPLLIMLPAPGAAEPVAILLTGETTLAERAFLDDLQSLWRGLLTPTSARLATQPLADPRRRLRALSRRRGDFALVNAASATVYLRAHPRLAALAVLWADMLHPLTRDPSVTAMTMPPLAEVWVFDQAPYPYPLLLELSANAKVEKPPIFLMEGDMAADALDYAQGPVLLHSAPWPDPVLAGIMKRDRTLRLLPFAPGLLEEFTLAVPWLISARLPAGSYPGQTQGLELPALHHILVARRDLPEAIAAKMLDTLYRHQSAMALHSPFFSRMESQLNAVFGKVLPFHPLTAKRFNFTSAAP